jgi:putative endonuclease
MSEKYKIGLHGENLAKKYLLDNNFNIRHVNWRFKHKELDIIAIKDSILHIIEVKTRSSDYWKEPQYAVVRRKQKNMIYAANAYIKKENIELETQFDIISIIMKNNEYKIEYIPNAFTASEI